MMAGHSCGLMMAIRWVAAVVLLLHADFGLALEPGKRLQQYVRETWTVDTGLPQSTVAGISQTPDGYIWIATQEGFVRFDGNTFKRYDKNSYPQISTNLDLALRAARDGSVYVGTMSGGLIHMRGEQITVLTEAHGLPNANVSAVFEATDGTIWIGTMAGPARLKDGRITPVPLNEIKDEAVTSFAEDATGRIWIGTVGGLASIDDGKATVYSKSQNFPTAILSLAVSREGGLWIGTYGEGLYRYRGGVVERVDDGGALGTTRILALQIDRSGTLWVGTNDRGFGRLRDGRIEMDGEPGEAVMTLFEDREGSLWIGRVSGLTRLADGVVLTYAKSEGLLEDDVKTVSASPDGTIWIGTREGLESLGGPSKRRPSRAHTQSSWVARDGSLWIGTGAEGLIRVGADGKETRFTAKNGLPGESILALYEDRRGVMWAGTNDGLARVVDGLVTQQGVPSVVTQQSISAIFEAHDGSIWVGTHDVGLHRINAGVANSFNSANGLSKNFVMSIFEDSQNTLWIGTQDGGLNRYRNGKLTAITTKQGLQDDSVFAILQDANGNLWMSSNKGIFRTKIADLNAVADGKMPRLNSVIYGRNDGMRSRECNGGTQPVAAKDSRGRLWFATTVGVAMIDPARLTATAPIARPVVSEIRADNVRLAEGKPIPAGVRTLEFHYTTPTFQAPNKLRFQYKLERFDPDWFDAETRRVAYYTNVPPGAYRFLVRAIDAEGMMTPQSAITVVVEPLFYQTSLFWGLIAFIILGAAWTAHQYRIRLIRASAERFKLLFDRNLAGVYRAHIDGRILDCNQACRNILGVSTLAELAERPIFQWFADEKQARELMQRLREDGAVSGVETELRRADGTPIWVLQNVSLAKSAQGHEVLEATVVDITGRRAAEEQIRYQAYHDALTDLPNRALFKERLSMAVAHAERRGRQVAVLFLDLDRFKLINDTLGHTVGDHLLQGVAERLKHCVRAEDSVARVGGDEFTVLLMDLRRAADAMVVARKILDVIAHPMMVDGHELFVTSSIGIAMSPNDGEDAETLLKNADNALYRAKEAGKNNYQLCTPSMTQLAAERLTLENSLRQAIDRHEFLLHYQPQVDLATRKIIGVEALLRWDRPGRGIVPPSEFIGAAEESRLIVPIGEMVLQTAAQQATLWNGSDPIRIAVNVSAAQFQQRNLPKTIQYALEQYGLDPKRLEVEITESTAMQNPTATADILHELKALGVSIVIDDFGIGHSSLNYLKRFPIDGLKIDRTFVQDMLSDASDAGIVSAIIAMAHALNLRVTAEGVETEQQLRFLESHGCSSIQGYLVSRPVPPHNITKMLSGGVLLAHTA